MKKRFLATVLALALTGSLLAGCGDDKQGGGDTQQTTETTADSPQDEADPDAQADDAQDSQADEDGGKASSGEDPIAGLDYNNADDWEKIKKQAKKGGFMLSEITMLTGEYVDLKYQFAKKVGDTTWESSDPSIVKVSKHHDTRIKAKSPGTAVIEGRSDDGFHTYCMVTVEQKPKSTIYLTFDDGPSRYSTPKVLDILKKNDVKATFFELKPAKADRDLTQRVIDEGHTLAIHGYKHKYDQIYRSDETYHKNLTKLQKLFYKKFGQWCTQTRFPGGSSNTVSRHYSQGIMTRLSKKVHEWGFLYQDWNVSSGDAGGANNADQVYKMVTSGIQKGRSNVILMHDFSGNDKTINALQRIIDWGKRKGFVFRAMTAATGEVHHGINN